MFGLKGRPKTYRHSQEVRGLSSGPGELGRDTLLNESNGTRVERDTKKEKNNNKIMRLG